jgi:3-methyladenine DNA glycosylase AlkD
MTQEPTATTAAEFTRRLRTFQSADELRKIKRYFTSDGNDVFIGVRMLHIFDLAKVFIDTPPAEIEKLLESPIHELRAGALSIMSKQAAAKKTTDFRRTELFDLYLRRHDRIDNWDLVDLAAPNVIGSYLLTRPRDILYELARSANPWERRTAIYSTLAFVRRGEVADTIAIAGILANDQHDLVQKPTGGMLREAGKKDEAALRIFLDEHAATLPRVTLRYAIERLDPAQRTQYLRASKAQ